MAVATSQVGKLKTLVDMISYDWSEDKAQVPLNIRDYWPYRDEIAVQDAIIYRGARVLISMTLRPLMLEKIR